MDFSNRHTNEFVYACDLERVLGGVFACHEEVKGSCVNTAVVNGVNVAIFDCTGGNGEEVKNSFYCHSVLDTESEVGKWTNAFVGQILKQVQNDTKGMASSDHSCHCERSEAIQENGDLFRLLRRFTPRNDSINCANNKKAGVK